MGSHSERGQVAPVAMPPLPRPAALPVLLLLLLLPAPAAPAAPAALLTLLTLFALFAKFDRKFRRALPPQGALVAPHSKARMESLPATPLGILLIFISQAPVAGQS